MRECVTEERTVIGDPPMSAQQQLLLLASLLFMLLLGIGATLRVTDIQKVLKHPRSFFVGIASQFGWMPLIAYIMVVGFGWNSQSGDDSQFDYWQLHDTLEVEGSIYEVVATGASEEWPPISTSLPPIAEGGLADVWVVRKLLNDNNITEIQWITDNSTLCGTCVDDILETESGAVCPKNCQVDANEFRNSYSAKNWDTCADSEMVEQCPIIGFGPNGEKQVMTAEQLYRGTIPPARFPCDWPERYLTRVWFAGAAKSTCSYGHGSNEDNVEGKHCGITKDRCESGSQACESRIPKNLLLGVTLILQGCTPGGSTSNLYTYFSRGDVALSVSMTVFSTILAFGAMPVLLLFYGFVLMGVNIDALNVVEILKQLALVLVPVSFGIMVRRHCSTLVANNVASMGSFFGLMAIFVIIGLGLADPSNQKRLAEAGFGVYFGCNMIGIFGMTISYVVSRLIGEPTRQARTISFETGIQNGPLTIAIAQNTFVYKFHNAEGQIPPVGGGDYIPDGLTIPLLYGLFISLISPFVMYFFLYATGAAKEDFLWENRREYRWLHKVKPEDVCDKMTALDMMERVVKNWGSKNAMAWRPSGNPHGKWDYLTFNEYWGEAKAFSIAMVRLGIKEGKGCNTLATGCPQWFITEMGSIMAGSFNAGHYITNTPAQISHIIIVIDSELQLLKIWKLRNDPYFTEDDGINMKAVVLMRRESEQIEGQKRTDSRAAAIAGEPWFPKDSKIASAVAALGAKASTGSLDEAQSERDVGTSASDLEAETRNNLAFWSRVTYWDQILQLGGLVSAASGSSEDFKKRRQSAVVTAAASLGSSRRVKPIQGPKMNAGGKLTPIKIVMDLEDAKKEVERRKNALTPSSICTLIYTSGTTGLPKAVVCTHRMVVHQVFAVGCYFQLSPDDSFVSYLPLSHVAEKLCSLYGSGGGAIVETLLQVQPTIFFGVPRVYEKFQAAMIKAAGSRIVYLFWCIPTGDWGRRQFKKISRWAKRIGLEAMYKLLDGDTTGINSFRFKLANELVFAKARNALGLNRARICLVAAAPVSLKTLEYFMSLRIPLLEAYGLSETCGPVTLSVATSQDISDWKIGSVGKPIDNHTFKINDDGEICVKGPAIMSEYYKDPIKTQEVFTADGYFKTGDIGTIDNLGFLRITDRKKDILITAGGENVAPAVMEQDFVSVPGISQVCLVGDRQKFIVALVTFDPLLIRDVAKAVGISQSEISAMNLKNMSVLKEREDFKEWFDKETTVINKTFPRGHQVKKWEILDGDFSSEGSDPELTGTQKLKRRVVLRKYHHLIRKIYGKDYQKKEDEVDTFEDEFGTATTPSSQAREAAIGKGPGKMSMSASKFKFRKQVGKLLSLSDWKRHKGIVVVSLILVDRKSGRIFTNKEGVPPSISTKVDTRTVSNSRCGLFEWLFRVASNASSANAILDEYTRKKITGADKVDNGELGTRLEEQEAMAQAVQDLMQEMNKGDLKLILKSLRNAGGISSRRRSSNMSGSRAGATKDDWLLFDETLPSTSFKGSAEVESSTKSVSSDDGKSESGSSLRSLASSSFRSLSSVTKANANKIVNVIPLVAVVEAFGGERAQKQLVDISAISSNYAFKEIEDTVLKNLSDEWKESAGSGGNNTIGDSRVLQTDIVTFADKHRTLLPPGLYVGYIKAKSLRSGMQITVDHENHAIIPTMRVCDPITSKDLTSHQRWLQSLRERVYLRCPEVVEKSGGGAGIKDPMKRVQEGTLVNMFSGERDPSMGDDEFAELDQSFGQKLFNATEKLVDKYGLRARPYNVDTMITKCIYNQGIVHLDQSHKIQLIIIVDPDISMNKKEELPDAMDSTMKYLPLSIFEQLHFSACIPSYDAFNTELVTLLREMQVADFQSEKFEETSSATGSSDRKKMTLDKEGLARIKNDKKRMFDKSNNLLKFVRWPQLAIQWVSVDRFPSIIEAYGDKEGGSGLSQLDAALERARESTGQFIEGRNILYHERRWLSAKMQLVSLIEREDSKKA